MSIASKLARVADLVGLYSLRTSQRLSSSAGRSPVARAIAQDLDLDQPVDSFLAHAGSILQHTGTRQRAYGHGEVLYKAVLSLSDRIPLNHSLHILEIGTARGFSSLVMAKALHDLSRPGCVLTVDIVRHDSPSYASSKSGLQCATSRRDLLGPWNRLVDDRLFYLCGSSQIVLETLQAKRFPLVFIDEHHVYKNTLRDLRYCAPQQYTGDQIIVDDYSERFPGVIRAVDKFLVESPYKSEIKELTPLRKLAILTRD